MALTVPTESLASIAQADAYHEARGNIEAWMPLENTRKEQLLRSSYDYLFAVYAMEWPAGVAFGTTDGLLVPDKVRDACSILALRAKAGELMPELKQQKTEVTVGPITTKLSQLDTGGLRVFPDIERLMAPYLAPRGNPYTATLVRN